MILMTAPLVRNDCLLDDLLWRVNSRNVRASSAPSGG